MNDQQIVHEVLKVVPDAILIQLVGSRASGKHKPSSDYDVRAVVPECKASSYVWQDYQSAIDCSILEQNGWDELNAPKIDLKVLPNPVMGDEPHRNLYQQ